MNPAVSHAIHPNRAAKCRENRKSHPPSSHSRICAQSLSASVSPGRRSTESIEASKDGRRIGDPSRTTQRAAPQHSGNPDARPSLQAISRGSDLVLLTRRSRYCPLSLCQDGKRHGPGDSSLVPGHAAWTPLCATTSIRYGLAVEQLRRRMLLLLCCTWVHASPLSGSEAEAAA